MRWYSQEKGFGFVEDADGKPLLVHYTGIIGEGFRTLHRGGEVEYEVEKDGRGRLVAANVRPVKGDSGRG